MPVILDETFEAGIPGGFATPGGAKGITATWDETAQAADLVYTVTQSFWRITSLPMMGDFWIEIDVELVDIAAGGEPRPQFGFWLYTGVGNYEGHRICTLFYGWEHSHWSSGGSEDEANQTQHGDSRFAEVGARVVLRLDAKQGPFDLWQFTIHCDGVPVYELIRRQFPSVTPCVFGRGVTLRLHRITAGTPSALEPLPPFAAIGYAPRLGHRILDLTTAQATHYNPRGFTKLLGIRNHYYHGNHRITGTVKEKAVPNDRPVSRRVFLFDERRHVLVRETWSDPVTGVYSFDEINSVPRYVVIAYDYKHNFRAVIADNLRAEPMPS